MRRFLKAATALLMIGGMCLNVHASSITELQEEKKEQEDKKAQAEAVVDQLQSEQNDILAAIESLDNQVTEYNNQINDLEIQKANLEVEIEETRVNLAAAQAEEQKQYDAMKLRIQYAYENGNVEYLDTVFSSSDISDIVNKSEYVEQIYNYDSSMLDSLIAIRKSIADTQLKLETDLEAVQEIEAEVNENKEAVEIMIEGKQVQVANYEVSIDEYEAQVAQLEAEIAATNDAIAAAVAEFEKQQQQASGGQSAPVYYTGGTFQWPVSSGGTITSYYGPRDMFGRSFHYGLDIGCPMGTPILAGESGTVVTVSYNGAAGNFLTIAHGGGVSTTYMHNSSIAVSVGQEVSRGQVIAYAGSTGQSTGPHCHFQLTINGETVNPLPYLQ